MNNIRSSFTDGMSVMWANVMSFVPKFLVFVAVLIVGYVIARVLARLFDALLAKLHFDELVERGGIKRVLDRSGYHARTLLAKLLFYTICLFTLQFAFGVFGPNPVSDLLTRVIAYLPSIFVAAIIIVVASAIAKGVRDILGASLGGFSAGPVIARLAATLIVIVGVFAALNQLGIAPTIVNGLFYAGLAIIAGSAIIAIGGGGIQPMRSRWERALSRMEAEAPKLRGQAQQTSAVAQAKAQEWTHRAEEFAVRSQDENRGQGQPELRPYDG